MEISHFDIAEHLDNMGKIARSLEGIDDSLDGLLNLEGILDDILITLDNLNMIIQDKSLEIYMPF